MDTKDYKAQMRRCLSENEIYRKVNKNLNKSILYKKNQEFTR